MTIERIIKNLAKHGYKVSRILASGKIVLEKTCGYGFSIVCESYAEAYKLANMLNR